MVLNVMALLDLYLLMLSKGICLWEPVTVNTAQEIKFSIKDFFSKCDQIRRKLRICSHLLKKPSMENILFFVLEMK